MSSKTKIAFCTDGIFPYTVGGMQRHSALLINELSKYKELQIIVIHPHQEKVFSSDNIIEVKIKPIDSTKNYLKECYKYSKRVFTELEKINPDLVYSQGLSVWYKLKSLKATVVVNPHGLEPFQTITVKERMVAQPFKIIFRRIFKRADYVVSLGGNLTNILKRIVSAHKIIELPNATNVPNFTRQKFSEKEAPLKLLFVARFASNKGIKILIDSIVELNKQGFADKLTFNLAGKGPLYDDFLKYYSLPNINYLGFVSDETLQSLYMENDVYVFPTLFEGMPTVVLEAMSYGMPVIVSDVGATAVLVNEDNGYLIKKNSSVEVINAIKKFYFLTSAEKKAMSQKSVERVNKNFSWSIVAQKHVDFFNQTLIK